MRSLEGEHGGWFVLPDGRRAHGVLTLAPARPPQVALSPDEPRPIGPEGRGFPEESEAHELVGRLHSNHDVVLGDVSLTEWFPNRLIASARWALVGLSIPTSVTRPWPMVTVRVTGLDTLLGNAFASLSLPDSSHTGPGRYSAELSSDADFESESGGVQVAASFEQSLALDPYRFDVTNYATSTLQTTSGLSVDRWIRDWLQHLVDLLTLATGEREQIDRVTFSMPDADSARHTGVQPQLTAQLWGTGIHQREQAAGRRKVSPGLPLVPLFTLANAPPLAGLLERWRTSLADETAVTLYRLSVDPDLPPQVGFLLRAQALEALDGHERAEIEAQEDEGFHRERTASLEALESVTEGELDSTIKSFLRKRLPTRPTRSLAERLHRLLTEVPPQSGLITAWTAQTEDLAAALDGLGRPSGPLHERLASARNALSHGDDLSPATVIPASRCLGALLRGHLLLRLGFQGDQLALAYQRLAQAADR